MKKNEGEFCVPRSLQENLVRRHQQRIDIDNNRSTSAKVPKQYSNEQEQNKKKQTNIQLETTKKKQKMLLIVIVTRLLLLLL